MQYYKILLMGLLCSLRLTVMSQEVKKASIKGRISAEHQEEAAGAVIVLKGTAYGAVAGMDGAYNIADIEPGSYTILFMSPGHLTDSVQQTLTPGQELQLNRKLQHDGKLLETVEIEGKTESVQLKESGFQVNVIDLKTQYNTSADINQVLNRTSGVRIREEGGLGSNFNFSLNGFSGNQVKFFLDGIPMDKFGSSLTLNNFPVNLAERIEIYKGVIPVSLGTDALGGAINIVSRKDLNYLDVSYSYGSFNTHKPAVSGAFTSKNGFTVRLNAFYNYTDNNYKVHVPIKDSSTASEGPAQWVRRFHDNYQSGTVQAEAGLTGKKYADKLLFGVIVSGNTKQIQTGVLMERVYGAMASTSRSLIPTLKYKKENLFVKGLDLSFYSAYNMNKFQLIDTTARFYNWLGVSVPLAGSSTGAIGGENSRTMNENKDKEFLSNANLSYRINHSNTLALNYLVSAFRRTSFDAANPDLYTNRFPSELGKQVAGLAWNANIKKRFTSSLFAKSYHMKSLGYQEVTDGFTSNTTYEAIAFTHNNVGYGLALAYFLHKDLQVKASFERAYRLPESNEIFGDGVFVIYSPKLRPEKSDNINAGIRYNKTLAANHKIGAEIGVIYRNAFDFIRANQVPGAVGRPTENMGKVKTKGIEGEVTYAYKKVFYSSVNATYQSIFDDEEYQANNGYGGGVTKNFYYGYRLPNIPYLFANANAGINLPVSTHNLSLNYTFNYVHSYLIVPSAFGSTQSNEKYIIPTQVAHTISATYSMAKGKYNVSLECRNLTDNMLFDSYRLQKPGRSFSVKIRYFINK